MQGFLFGAPDLPEPGILGERFILFNRSKAIALKKGILLKVYGLTLVHLSP